METAEEHVYSAWQEQKAQEEEKMREKRSIGIDLHRRRFTCCVRLENGRNYLSEWSLEQLPQFIKKLRSTDEIAVEVTGNTRLFYPAVVLVNRLNIFWGLDWQAVPANLGPHDRIERADVVIGCVDTRAARAAIREATGSNSEVD